MVRLTWLMIVWLMPVFAYADFVHPLQFTKTPEQQQAVKTYISEMVSHRYCQKKGFKCSKQQRSQLEYLEMKAFKQAVQQNNPAYLNQAIFDACAGHSEWCSYQDIMMYYRQHSSH